MMTLEQILFSQGFGTRKICRALITERKVKINKSICDDINSKWDINGYDNDPTGFTFSVHDILWTYQENAYLMLNKPKGYECTQRSKSNISIFSLLPAELVTRGVQAVGRLDLDTTGLLLFSDDGQFIHKMTSPKHNTPKVYEVTTAELVNELQLAQLNRGVILNDSPNPVSALTCMQTGPRQIQMTLTSGKYHQVKRMLAAVGNHVTALHRSQINQLQLPESLAQGKWRWLTKHELDLLFIKVTTQSEISTTKISTIEATGQSKS